MRQPRQVDAFVESVVQRLVTGKERAVAALVTQEIADAERNQPAKQVSQFGGWGFGRETALDQPLPGLIGEPRRALETCPAVWRLGDAGLVQQLFGEGDGTDAVAAGDRRQ